ncbi:MAG: hypothetical protein Q4C80_07920 [Bacillota bacterium]|nr:hypothetical protein [Bacillota bacterium]
MDTEKNIRIRSDGRYEARYVKTRDERGRVIYASCYGKTREEVIDKRNKAVQEIFIEENKPQELNLLVLGAGSHGQEVYEIASQLHIFGKIDFLDDNEDKDNVIGSWELIDSLSDEYAAAIVAVGNEDIRKLWFAKLSQAGYVSPTLVHPSAIVSPKATVGAGSVICARAAISPGARIGAGCIISAGVAVARDDVIDDWTHIEVGGIVKW